MPRLLIPIASLIFFLHTPLFAEDLESTIQYLLDYVKNSEVVFIRNSHEHRSHEAAAHMRKKYAHFKDKIRTPEDFIRLTGTKSLMTGKYYQIRTKDGVTMPAQKWLEGILKEYRMKE